MLKTKIIKENDKDIVKKCVSVLKKGGLFIYPTETCYGIGADATKDDVVKKVFDVKQRPFEKNIIIAFSDLEMVKNFLTICPDSEKLVNKLMPGPLTVVDKGVGFRIPKNDVVIKIIKKFGKPITTTSANFSGTGNHYEVSDIIRDFQGKVNLIIDSGNLPKTPSSTMFDVVEKTIIREGPVSKEEIMKALKS
jgi:L-threonylcarbamoyladenylate synthase